MERPGADDLRPGHGLSQKRPGHGQTSAGAVRAGQSGRQLLRKWREDWKLSDPLVELAATYARNTREPMLYMDKLLSGWRDKDITTVAEAEEEHRRFAEAAAADRAKAPAPVKKVIEQQYSQRDYDPDEYSGMSQADIEEAKKL